MKEKYIRIMIEVGDDEVDGFCGLIKVDNWDEKFSDVMLQADKKWSEEGGSWADIILPELEKAEYKVTLIQSEELYIGNDIDEEDY